MTTLRDEHIERLWQAQEAARLGQGGDRADRLVAQALATPAPMALPADFAAQMARLAHEHAKAPAPFFEWALAALAGALLLLAGAWAWRLNPAIAASLVRVWDAQPQPGWVLWLAAALLGAAWSPSVIHHRPSP